MHFFSAIRRKLEERKFKKELDELMKNEAVRMLKEYVGDYLLPSFSDTSASFQELCKCGGVLLNGVPLVDPSKIKTIYFLTTNHQSMHKLLTFGEAIEALKQGKKVAREGWNGKGMFLWLKPATTIKSDWCKDPILKFIVDANGGETEALGTICMKTADGKVLTGWLASQTDMLLEDWMIIE